MECSSCDEVAPRDDRIDEEYQTEQKQDEVTEAVESNGNEVVGPTTDNVTCGDCGNGRASYRIMQTRAADEPPTRFYKCVECGNRWRG